MTELAITLSKHPNFRWREGMRDTRGLRVVELDLWDAAAPPDLADPATGGCLLAALDETGRLTDVVREGGEWIVAVDLPQDGLYGWAADTLAEAAAYALLGLWDAMASDPDES